MVIFDQLRISDDAKMMFIDVHVNAADYFENVYLDSITIMTADKVSELDPKSPTSDYIYKQTLSGNQKNLSLVLTPSDFMKTWEDDPNAMKFTRDDMAKTLFFVYVTAKGVPGECTPCGMDEKTTVGTVYDRHMVYEKAMNLTRELADTCKIPVAFTDFILLQNAYNYAVDTGHYVKAIDFFNKMFDIVGNPTVYSKCGCHG